MAVLKYEGSADVRELWGVSFPWGKTVEVDDPDLVKKALCLDGFVRVDAEDVIDPPAGDYEPVEDVAEGVPEVGAGLVPEGWESLHWKQRVKLAKDLTGRDDIEKPDDADAAIREAMEPK